MRWADTRYGTTGLGIIIAETEGGGLVREEGKVECSTKEASTDVDI